MSLRSRASAVRRAAWALPWLLRSRRAIRRTADLRSLILAHDRSPKRRTTRTRSVDDVRRATAGAIRLLGPRQKDCLPRALTHFALLTREGYGAEFVSGVRRDGDALVSHAWVELDGEVIDAPGDGASSSHYREQFRVPSRTARDRDGISSPVRSADL